MSSPEYPRVVLEYVQSQGWSTNVNQLRKGSYIIAGSRESDSKSERILLMIVCEPEKEVTVEHVKYLYAAIKKKEANVGVITSRVSVSTDAQRAIEQHDILIIDPENIISNTESQAPESNQNSDTGQEEQNHSDAYEVYGSKKKMILVGIGGLVLSVGGIWILLSGLSRNVLQLVIVTLSIPFFLFCALIVFYQIIDRDPVLRIAKDGINFNPSIGNSVLYQWDNIQKVSRVEQQMKLATVVHLQIQVSETENKGMLSEALTQLDKAAIGDDSDAVYIPIETYGIDFEEVERAIKQYSDVPVTANL